MQEYYLKKKIEELVTNDLVKAEYDKLVADFKPEEEVHARHILLKTEQEAKDVIKLLDDGGDFASLAKEYSTGPSGPKGGDLGYFTKERMVPEFATPAFALNKGEYTKTPVKTQFGYHVIKVEDKRETQPPSFEEKQAELHSRVENTVIEKLINELKAAATIVLVTPEPAEAGKPEGADVEASPADESSKKE
ncbi:MAG: peptidyl-prolyl cis-trans isomerase [Sneathiella sp.]|nr:peptidyl-prolyl cis-trans isomerase [Sneathiella sp.]